MASIRYKYWGPTPPSRPTFNGCLREFLNGLNVGTKKLRLMKTEYASQRQLVRNIGTEPPLDPNPNLCWCWGPDVPADERLCDELYSVLRIISGKCPRYAPSTGCIVPNGGPIKAKLRCSVDVIA